MKISIGTNIKEGPWGGGNLFAINLKEYLNRTGHIVTNDLNDDDIDIILITEPRRTSESSAFTHIDVENYLKYVNNDAVVVHRINECDERKNTNYVNKYLIQANTIADATVFVSSWLAKIYLSQGINQKRNQVILAGANSKIFNNNNKELWNKSEKLKIVTHHWGANWNKGFEVYEKLDKLLNKESYNDKFIFTYIGNLPKKFSFQNTEVISPLSGTQLAKEIKKNHVYLTASINEPSGNHHIEGAQCGLPLLYINSGGIPEYGNGFGVEFDTENFSEKLHELRQNYVFYSENINNYPFTSEKMCQEYELLFNELIKKKSKIIKERRFTSNISKLGELIYKSSRYISGYNSPS